MAYSRPRNPSELAEWRMQLIEDRSYWTRYMPVLASLNNDFDDLPAMHDSIRAASLWWVGADCCNLLNHVAPTMPPVTLTEDLVPENAGLAFFERPIIGTDSVNEGQQVSFDCIHWQPLQLTFLPDITCVAIFVWAVAIFDHYKTVGPLPLGRSDWPYGFDTDQFVDGFDVPDQTRDSIMEDRRLLAALWQLSSQPNIAEVTEQRPNRAAAKRIARKGYDPSPIRLVSLNQRVRRARTASSGTREYTHQWTVDPHWRKQPYGPGRSFRRAIIIPFHLRGPEDKPLRIRQTVKFWDRLPPRSK